MAQPERNELMPSGFYILKFALLPKILLSALSSEARRTIADLTLEVGAPPGQFMQDEHGLMMMTPMAMNNSP